ncbi:MAG: hypothetical protein ABIH83_01070 [Candidatus Micrarchaeota archaeon]
MEKIRMLALFFAVLFSINIASAQDVCFGQTMNWALEPRFAIGGGALIGYGILIMAFLCVGAYMIGKAFSKPEFVVWGASEGVTLVWSILLIIGVLAAFIFSCELSQKIAEINNPNKSPAHMATLGLNDLNNKFGITIAKDLQEDAIHDMFEGMYYAYWSIPAMDGGGLAYRANKRAWATQREVLIDIYLPLSYLLHAQELFLEILMPGVIAIILPAALFFRMLFVTRDVGNILIALSFSIYFAFPLVYLLAFSATENMTADFEGDEKNPFEKMSLAKDMVVGDAFQKIGYLAAVAVLLPNLALVIVITMTMSLYKAMRGIVA